MGVKIAHFDDSASGNPHFALRSTLGESPCYDDRRSPVMKIVVTGGSGRIGSETARLLRERGHDVLTLDVRPPADASLAHRVVDLRAASALRKIFDGMDIVLHLGEMPGPGDTPSEGYTHNTEVGATVMQAACQMGVKKLIYTSSCQVYGLWGIECGPVVEPQYLPLDEKHPMQPQNPYALSKAANEQFAWMMSRRFGIPVAAYRFPAVWSSPLSEIVEWTKRRKRFEVPRDGLGAYLHISDAASAYVCGVERDWTGFEAFHFVANDHRYATSSRQAMLERFPHAPLPEDWHADASPVSTAKARDMLGWVPKVNLRETILSNIPPMSAVA